MSVNSGITHKVRTEFIRGMPCAIRIESTLQIDAATTIGCEINDEWRAELVRRAKRDNAKQILRKLLDELTKGVLDAT